MSLTESDAKDRLLAAMIGVARTTDGTNPDKTTRRVIDDALWSLKENTSEDVVSFMIKELHQEKYRLSPSCKFCASPCGRHDDYKLSEADEDPEPVKKIKKRILERLKEEKIADDMKLYQLIFSLGERWDAESYENLLKEY